MLRSRETSQVALLQKLGQAWKFEGRICALQWQGRQSIIEFGSGRSVHF
jgi:hypothetical protein